MKRLPLLFLEFFVVFSSYVLVPLLPIGHRSYALTRLITKKHSVEDKHDSD